MAESSLHSPRYGDLLRNTGINAEIYDRVKNTVGVVEGHREDLSNLVGHVDVEGSHQNLWNAYYHSSQDDRCSRDYHFCEFDLVFNDSYNDENV